MLARFLERSRTAGPGAGRCAPARELPQRRVPPQRGARDADPRGRPRADAPGQERRRSARRGSRLRRQQTLGEARPLCQGVVADLRRGRTEPIPSVSSGTNGADNFEVSQMRPSRWALVGGALLIAGCTVVLQRSFAAEAVQQHSPCAGYRCQEGACRTHCAESTQCATGYLCEIKTGACLRRRPAPPTPNAAVSSVRQQVAGAAARRARTSRTPARPHRAPASRSTAAPPIPSATATIVTRAPAAPAARRAPTVPPATPATPSPALASRP